MPAPKSRAGLLGREEFFQSLNFDGLDKIAVKSGFHGAPTVFVTTPAAHSDKEKVVTFRELANSPRRFVAVHARHANVHKRQVRPELCYGGERGQAVISDAHVDAQKREERDETIRDVLIVVDDKNAMRRLRPYGLASLIGC